jgi:alginate O-acetyltransferase complex protein AlgI
MLFTDPAFLFLFLPVVAALFYYVAPRFGTTAALVVLFLSSLVFYAPWGLKNSLLLILSFSVNFTAAYFLLLLPDSRKALRRALHILGQLYNFGMLFWFKYSFFVTHMFSPAGNGAFSLVNIAIPIGISFYTFQQAMFLLETYDRDPHVEKYMGKLTGFLNAARAYLRYTVFVVFFPHLVIGPIVYLDEFQPQVDSNQFGRYKRSNIEVGLVFITLGMFKKVVLADNLAPIVNTIFASSEQGHHISMLAAWVGALSYYVQLYFDFSGYADMALGTARIFGIRYPMNFYSPYKAVGLIDYWRRFHITLTRVLARFLYTPLSIAGTRFAMRRKLPKFPARVLATWIPILINFEMIALWHGARWTFILFGVTQGIWYLAETEIRRSNAFLAWVKMTPDALRAFIGRAILTVLMTISLAAFRSDTLVGFGHIFRQMFGGDLHGPMPVSLPKAAGMLTASFAIIWLLPNSVEFLRRYRPAIQTYENKMYVLPWLRFAWRPTWAMSAVITVMFIAALYFIGRRPPFLYMGF